MEQIFHIAPPRQSPYVVIISIVALLLVMAVGFILISASMKKVSYTVTGNSLKISALFFGRTIPLDKIQRESVSVLDLKARDEYSPAVRTGGIGLPGFKSGWFKLKNGDKALLFMSDPEQLVLVPLKEDYVLLLSTTDPQGLVGALKR